MLSLAVRQDISTYKDPEYDLAHQKSPIAGWLERPTLPPTLPSQILGSSLFNSCLYISP